MKDEYLSGKKERERERILNELEGIKEQKEGKKSRRTR